MLKEDPALVLYKLLRNEILHPSFPHPNIKHLSRQRDDAI